VQSYFVYFDLLSNTVVSRGLEFGLCSRHVDENVLITVYQVVRKTMELKFRYGIGVSSSRPITTDWTI